MLNFRHNPPGLITLQFDAVSWRRRYETINQTVFRDLIKLWLMILGESTFKSTFILMAAAVQMDLTSNQQH